MLKAVLVDFFTSEEARLEPRSLLLTGSTLTVILAIALLMITLSPQPALAYQCCAYPGCPGWCCMSPSAIDSYDAGCPPEYGVCRTVVFEGHGGCLEEQTCCQNCCCVCGCSQYGWCGCS